MPYNWKEYDDPGEDYHDGSKVFCHNMKDNKDIFKNPIKVFQEKNIGKLNYFHLTINIKLEFVHTGSHVEYDSLFIYDYFFCKTKGNKYLFRTIFKERNKSESDDVCTYDWSEENIRYCYTKRFNDFYFNNTELKINRLPEDFYYKSLPDDNEDRDFWDNFYFKEFNTVKINSNYWDEDDCISFFGNNALGNYMETINLNYLYRKYNLFKNIKKI